MIEVAERQSKPPTVISGAGSDVMVVVARIAA
jgi:hypothetical protein